MLLVQVWRDGEWLTLTHVHRELQSAERHAESARRMMYRWERYYRDVHRSSPRLRVF